MNIENLFINATRNKVRFPFKGMINVEDLWDLSLLELDSIFKTLNSKLKTASEESLLTVKTKENDTIKEQIEIIKYIVYTKQEEKIAKENEIKKSAERQKILKALKEKRDKLLSELSEEELIAKLDELDR